jgi:hypothetical protein
MLLPLLLLLPDHLCTMIFALLAPTQLVVLLLLLSQNLFLLNLIHNQVLYIDMVRVFDLGLFPADLLSSPMFRKLFPLQRGSQILMSLMRQLFMLAVWREDGILLI